MPDRSSQLRVSEQAYRKIFKAAPSAIAITHLPDRRFIDCNKTFEHIFGYSRKEIIGKTAGELNLWKNDADRIRMLPRYLKAGNFEVGELELLRKSGETVIANVNFYRMNIAGEEYSIANISDITQLKQTERAMQKLNKLSKHMVSMVAHELKTPLTLIQGYAQLLRDGDVGPVRDEQQEILDIIVHNSKRLEKLVNSFLDLEKIEAGAFHMERQRFQVEKLLAEVKDMFNINMKDKRVGIQSKLEKGLSVYGDRYQLLRLFSNLVSNAIKFSDSGSILIRAKKDGDHVAVEVIDEGIGISKQDINQIFERFYQSEDALFGRPNEGVGLGLAICKAIVEEHCGTIRVKSKRKIGSTFTVRLPLAEHDQEGINSNRPS